MDPDAMLSELAHIFQTPLTGVTAGADLLARLVPDLRAKQRDPLKELVKRNSETLKQRIDAVLALASVEGDAIVLRLTPDDLARIHCATAEESEIEIRSSDETPAAAAPVARNGMSVLVADDENDLRALLVSALSGQGYRVIDAKNGAEALEKIERERPDVLVLDGLMPKVGGFDVCQRAKSIDPAYQPKVILVTAIYKKRQYQSEAARVGVDEFLTKPFEVDELLRHVATLAGRKPALTS